jgi:hypothetical protein
MTYTVAEMKKEMLAMRERMKDHEGLMDQVSSENIVKDTILNQNFLVCTPCYLDGRRDSRFAICVERRVPERRQ